MFAEQIQVCHITERMRPLHVTYRTGPQHRAIVWRGHIFPGCCLAYLLSFPWNSGAKLIQQVEVKNQKTCRSTYQLATHNLSFWGVQQIKFSIINWDDGMHSISLNSPNSNEPLVKLKYRVANQYRITTDWRNRWVETLWSSGKAEAYAWNGKSMSGTGWRATGCTTVLQKTSLKCWWPSLAQATNALTIKVRCTLTCIGRTAGSRLRKAITPLCSHL